MNTKRPDYHDNLLLVSLRPDDPSLLGATSFRTFKEETNPGLSMLDTLERGGFIKSVTPLSPSASMAAPRAALAKSFATSVRADLPGASQRGMNIVELEPGVDIDEVRRRLGADAAVDRVERVPVRYLVTHASVMGPGIAAAPPPAGSLWNLDKIAWKQARDDVAFKEATNIKVAVLDTGVDEGHPDLDGKIKKYTYEHADLVESPSPEDIVGHGTHVSGIIAAGINNGIGVNGICDCAIHVWKIFGDKPLFAGWNDGYVYVVDPILYLRALQACIDEHVHVVNLSIGGTGTSAEEAKLFKQMVNAGIIVVAAMGNERQEGNPIEYPAAHQGVIAVGATGRNDKIAQFSNTGGHIALSAPGVAIWSTLPRTEGQFGFNAVPGPNGSPMIGSPKSREVDYDAWDGTSMATPHVAAAAALLKANANAPVTPATAKQRLMQSADAVPGMSGHSFTYEYGAGRLNLKRLLWT